MSDILAFLSVLCLLVAWMMFFGVVPRKQPEQGAGEMHRCSDINVLALVKGHERYVWLYRDVDAEATIQTIGRFASNPELSFTWYDAAVLSRKVRTTGQQR